MQLTFSTTVCPNLLLPDALNVATDAGFDRIELFRTFSESSPVHADTSVRMVRERLDNAGVTLTGLNIRNITGRNSSKDERDLSYNMRQVEWDIHLSRALRLQCANLKGGDRTDEAREDFITGINHVLERVSDFTLNIGNHKGNLFENIEDYQRILPEIPDRARVLMDTGHLLSAEVICTCFCRSVCRPHWPCSLERSEGGNTRAFWRGRFAF